MVGLTHVRFLVVDDNAHMLSIVEAILRGFGARKIVCTTSAGDAISHLQRNAVDILITDYMLDGVDIAEFAGMIRRAGPPIDRFIPIILLTAHSSRPRIEAARDAGVTEICCKPVTPRELFRRIVAIVDYPRGFILSEAFLGPDRRRRADADYRGEERRHDRLMGAAPESVTAQL
ncbi:MAG: response regulator [Asticcacaulis sp.]